MSERSEHEVLQLKDHLVSGNSDEWAVYTQTGYSARYNNYQDALNKFNELPAEQYPALYLYTRLGTSVLFQLKKP